MKETQYASTHQPSATKLKARTGFTARFELAAWLVSIAVVPGLCASSPQDSKPADAGDAEPGYAMVATCTTADLTATVPAASAVIPRLAIRRTIRMAMAPRVTRSASTTMHASCVAGMQVSRHFDKTGEFLFFAQPFPKCRVE